jgi:hypothetical protein
VSAFVDQQKMIASTVVDGVARDFDLGDSTAAGAMTPPQPEAGQEKFDLVDALRSLASLADRLREKDDDKGLPQERKL